MQEDKDKISNSRIASHYTDVAASYNEAIFTQGDSEHQKWELNHFLRHLRLQKADRVVDLGCGTGIFTSALYTKSGLANNILGIDPSEEMLRCASSLPGITTRHTDGLSFAKEPAVRYDKIFMKGVVHHIPLASLPSLYQGIHQQLQPNGILLVVTRPVQIDLPFFQAALELWVELESPVVNGISLIEEFGFSVSCYTYHRQVQVPKHQWFEMIQNRFWSTFSFFDDTELKKGIEELEAKYAHTDILSFEDSLIFVECVRN